MKTQIQHWAYGLATFFVALFSGIILLPLLRKHPESVHDFILRLEDWQRVIFIFVLCILYAYTMFKLFSPRLVHLRHGLSHPPTWIAWLVGVIAVAVVDLRFGLQPGGYEATPLDWIGYVGGSILLVWAFRLATGPSSDRPTSSEAKTLTLENVASIKWDVIEEWLHWDSPAAYDFLGNYVVAKRIIERLKGRSRSIGLVGRFGAGKTSIVEWIKKEIATDSKKEASPKLFVSEHSCWGFTNSSNSIHEMLANAIAVVESEIDTFHVSSLPESYRQTFSAGGEWIDSISNLVFGKRDPSEQFGRLSDLLGEIDARLVIVVEDLDRNDSRSFDTQEVLAFLQQLKEFENLRFILAAGQSNPPRIDFGKLCDHIEYLRSISPSQAFTLARRVRERCHDQSVFPHVDLGAPDRQYQWNPRSGLMLRDLEAMSLSDAVSVLLSTPRALRHTLERTYESWKNLCGEIDWDHLLAVNVLRFAAPECFSFIVQHWDRLKSAPSDRNAFGKERMKRIKETMLDEWQKVTTGVEWNQTAAEVVMEFILPSTSAWLGDERPSGSPPPQGVQYERYWIRALNESIPPDSTPDQAVIRDILQWQKSQNADSPLIVGICESDGYSNVWEDVAGPFFADKPGQILLICEQVVTRILSQHGSAASHNSQGFIAVWRFANRRVSNREENANWVKERISDAAKASLELVNSIWHYFGTPGQYSILRREDCGDVRTHEIQALRSEIRTADDLKRVMHASYPYVLYQLVFDPGDHNPQSEGDISEWAWLSPVLLDSLRNHDAVIAVGVSSMVASRRSGDRSDPFNVNSEVLFRLFPNDAREVVSLLSQIADAVEEDDQQQLVRAVADSAQAEIQERLTS